MLSSQLITYVSDRKHESDFRTDVIGTINFHQEWTSYANLSVSGGVPVRWYCGRERGGYAQVCPNLSRRLHVVCTTRLLAWWGEHSHVTGILVHLRLHTRQFASHSLRQQAGFASR